MSQDAGNFTDNGAVQLTVKNAVGGNGAFNTLYGSGDFGGGTLAIYASPDTTYASAVALEDISLTAAGYVSFQVKAATLWVVLSGATAPNVVWDVI